MFSDRELRDLLCRLDGEPADAIESQDVECKPWDRNPAARASALRDLRETAVCLANARGGVILLGIADRKRTRLEALHGVADLDSDTVRTNIYNGTEPHILVDVQELREPEGRILAIRVPRGMPPHMTTEGVGKIRIGKECLPLTPGRLSLMLFAGGALDVTAQAVPEATPADLDSDQVRLLRLTIEREGGNPDLVRLEPEELLRNLGLVRDGEVTMAALLLVGRPAALARWLPHHEVTFIRFRTQTRYDVRHDLRGPLLVVVERLRELVQTHTRLETIPGEGFAEKTLPDLTWWAVREGVINALAHRDYFLRQTVFVEVHADRMQIASPGGFVGGVRAENILRHEPVRRNPHLASVLQHLGLVNRAGLGVDRIYEDLLRLGKGMPQYRADEGNVRLILPTRSHAPFAAFIAEQTRAGARLELNDLILLRAIAERGSLNRWSAAPYLQCPEEAAAEMLASLRARHYLTAQGRGRGTAYRLSRPFSDRLRGALTMDGDTFLDEAEVRRRVESLVVQQGRLSNAELRRISGVSRGEALRLMQALARERLVVLKGRGRGAHYVPGPGIRVPQRSRPGRKPKR